MIARLWAKIKEIIMAVKIFGAEEGFLPKAFILAKLQAEKTAHGPRIHKPKIKTKAKFLLIPPRSLRLCSSPL